MESFLQKIASYLLENYQGRTTEVAIVFPNRRASLFLRDHLSKMIDKPLWMPRIFGIEEFMEEVSGLKITGNVDLLFVFYEAYRSVEKENPQEFSDFMQWGQVLLHDFNEIDQQLADTDEFFNYLHEVRKIESWNTADHELTALQKNYLEFWKKAKGYYQAFRDRLIAERRAYNGLAARTAADGIERYIREKAQHKKFLFAGFNALTKAEEHIFQFLMEKEMADVLWDADIYYMEDPAQEAGFFLRQYRKHWKQKEFRWTTNELNAHPKKIEVIGVAQHIGQAKLAGQLVRELSEHEQMRQTAVVLADEDLLQPVLQSLPENCREVNVTMGNTLVNAAVAGLFESMINLFISRSPQGFYHADLIRLIRQKYFAALFTEAEQQALHTFGTSIREKNLVFVSLTGLPESLRDTEVFTSLGKVKNVKQLLLLFRSMILKLKDWFMDRQQEGKQMELEYLLSFYQLVNRFSELLEKHAFIDAFKTFRSLFKTALLTEKLDFKGEPLSGLQVMGMLETRNLDFRTVILLSVNEGVIPAGKTHHTFIPYDVKQKYHLPSFREKDAMFAYHFYRLIQKAEKVYLIYNTETDEFGSGEKSRFIAQLQDELKPRKNISWHSRIAATPVRPSPPMEVVIPNSPVVTAQMIRLMEKGLSPTAISTYINCPLDFYYRYLLGLKEEEAVEEVIEAHSLGSVIHEVLEKLYHPFKGKQLLSEDIDRMIPQIRPLTEQTFLKDFSRENLEQGKNFLSLEVTGSYLHEFLRQEKEFLKNNPRLFIRAIEKKLVHPLRVTHPGGETTVQLSGKIDRVDEVNDMVRIIDYKSGQAMPGELQIREMEALFSGNSKALQVMIYNYLYAMNHAVHASRPGILSFRKISLGFMSLRLGNASEVNSEMIAEFESHLLHQLQQMLDPHTSFRHNPDSLWCRFCNK